MKGKPFLRRVATGLCAIFAIVFALVWNERRQIAYNDQGRHFDAEQGIVLLEQSVSTYAVLAICFALLAVTSWLGRRRK